MNLNITAAIVFTLLFSTLTGMKAPAQDAGLVESLFSAFPDEMEGFEEVMREEVEQGNPYARIMYEHAESGFVVSFLLAPEEEIEKMESEIRSMAGYSYFDSIEVQEEPVNLIYAGNFLAADVRINDLLLQITIMPGRETTNSDGALDLITTSYESFDLKRLAAWEVSDR